MAALSATGWTSSTSKVMVSQASKDRCMKALMASRPMLGALG